MNDYNLYYILSILVFALTFAAQSYVRNIYSKYSNIQAYSSMNGASVARDILDRNGLNNISVNMVNGFLSDHYDPRNMKVALSQNNYESSSVSALAIAAHECGHALQHKESYAFLNIRTALMPVANISSYMGYFAIMLGAFTNMMNLVWIGILLEGVILLFQIVTLPVEFDASRRALMVMEEYGYVSDDQKKYAKKVLTAAALTYVAGVATTLMYILRLLLSFVGSNRRNRR